MADSFQLKAIITGVDKLSPVLAGISKNIKKAGKGFKEKALLTSAMGTGLALSFAKPIKDAMEFESSMADVRKVVNFDRPQQFQQMSQDILDMSTRLPMAANDIAKIVAAGGQAGIAAGGLEAFTTDAVKMGIAFDEGADVAGQQMAQWRVSLGLTQQQVEQLGDQINYLGNTGPVASNQLTDVVTDVGVLGSQAHLSAGEVAALGDTIMASGTQADKASTGIKRVITTLAGGHLTKLQRAAFHSLRLNPKKISKEMATDGKKALLDVFTALSHVKGSQNQIGITKALFGQESIEAITPLLANLRLLEDNFQKVGDASRYAGSMQKEYASRASTTKNQLELVQNDLNKISVETGDALLPAVSDGLHQAMPLLDSIANFVKSNPEVVKMAAGAGVGLAAIGGMAAIGALVAAAGPIGILLGGLVAAATYIAENWDFFTKTIPKVTGKTMGEWSLQGLSDSGDINDLAVNAYLNKHPEIPSANPVSRGITLSREMANITNPLLNINRANSAGYEGYDYGASSARNLIDGGKSLIANMMTPPVGDLISGGKSLIAGEMVVRFENAPPGMRVSEGKTNAPNVRLVPEVGYNPYSIMRRSH